MSTLSPYKPKGDGRLRLNQLSSFERRSSPSTVKTVSSEDSGLSSEELELIGQIARKHKEGQRRNKNKNNLHASAPNLNFDPFESDNDDDISTNTDSQFAADFVVGAPRRSKTRSMSLDNDTVNVFERVDAVIKRRGSMDGHDVRNKSKSNSLLSSMNASAPNLNFDPTAEDSDDDDDEQAMEDFLSTVKSSKPSRSKSFIEPPTASIATVQQPRARSMLLSRQHSADDLGSQSNSGARKKKKKRILVRASELGLNSSSSDAASLDGCSVDSREIEEAVRRWSSEHKDVRGRRRSVTPTNPPSSQQPQEQPQTRPSMAEKRRSASRSRSKSRPRSAYLNDRNNAKSPGKDVTSTPAARRRTRSIGRDENGRTRSLPRMDSKLSLSSDEDVTEIHHSPASKPPGDAEEQQFVMPRRSRSDDSNTKKTRSKSRPKVSPHKPLKSCPDHEILGLGILTKMQLEKLRDAGYSVAK